MGKPRKPPKQGGVNPQDPYSDPHAPGALGGVARFAKAQGMTLKQARQHLRQHLAHTLHRPARRRFRTNPVVVFNIDQQWVADLVEMPAYWRQNRGVRFLLTVIDVLSKYAWVQPIKHKTGPEIRRAFETIVEEGRSPQTLQTDKGKEFYNKPFQTWLKQQGIHHFSTHGDAKAAVIERFNRTLKERLYRYMTAANTVAYLPAVAPLVRQYNADEHSAIVRAPDTVTTENETEVWNHLYEDKWKKTRKRGELRVGDRVRLSKHVRTFKKGYMAQWTEEVFVIRRIVPGVVLTYKIEEMDGTPLKGSFYRQDLQKVTVNDRTLWRVEKVLKRRKGEAFVQWKGWPAKYNSWIKV